MNILLLSCVSSLSAKSLSYFGECTGFFKVIIGIPCHCRRYKLMFEYDMNCPQEARNDPNRLEPATNADTGI